MLDTLGEIRRRVLPYLENALHCVYIIYIVITLGSLWFAADSIKGYILTACISILVIILVVYQLLITYKLEVKSRYAEAQTPMHICQHELRDLYRYLSRCLSDDDQHSNITFEEAEFKARLTTAITALNTAFCIVTSNNCRVSIKLLGVETGKDPSNTDNLFLSTIARDEVSARKKKDVDKAEKTKHKLNANSDFQCIYQELSDWYANGELWKDTSYRNSNDSRPQDGKSRRKDYNSTIVWPIRYKLHPDEPPQKDNENLNQILLGFLTVDAMPSNSFLEQYDIDMGAQVADILYIVLERYREVKRKQTGG